MEKHENRAQRLGALLASRNALVRREAAQALGNFPLTNPHVTAILRSIFQSTVWDIREAAVEAFRFILKAMPPTNRVVIPQTDSISRLCLTDVVRTYHPLLSCEAELITRMSVCSFGEQRKMVDEQLDFQSVVGVSSGTFLSEEDFVAAGSAGDTTPERKLVFASAVDAVGVEASLEELDAAVHSICVHLIRNVVDVKWEIRHGAALGIACILSTVPSRLSSSLVDVLARRLFEAIVLDKFIDFSSGRTAVGPVREALAECIARLIMAYPYPEFVDIIFKHIYALHTMTYQSRAERHNTLDLESHKRMWFQRQAALLIIKYHLAGPSYAVKFDEVFQLLMRSFEDPHDEVCASALSAITTLFCKEDLKPEVSKMISHLEHVIYRFIDSACNVTRNQLLDIDTVAVDLLSLLIIWLQGDSSRRLPYVMLKNLSRILNPLHITLSLKIVNVFSVSFSRPAPFKDENDYKQFETCIMSVLLSLFRIVLFAAPYGTEDLIEACVTCACHIVKYFLFTKRLPQALVETIGRWTACLFIDARNAEIDLEKCNVGSDVGQNSTECLCGDEIRSLSDMVRIDVLLTRKVHVARFLAPLISTIYSFPSKIGDQSFNEAIQLLITPSLKSLVIMHKLGGVLLSHAWFTYVWRSCITIDVPNYLAEILHSLIMSPNAAYDDEKMFYLYLDNAYKDFASYCRRKGVSEADVFSVEERDDTIDNNASALFNICCNILRDESDRETLRARYEGFKYAVATAKAVMTSNISRVNAMAVSSLLLIYPRTLLDSPSLNPFVKPLMELIRYEENVIFAQYALNAIPILFRIASEKKPSPHAKMIKQIVVSLVSCSSRFPPQFDSQEELILSRCVKGPFSARSQNAEYVIRMLVAPIAGTDMASLVDFRKRDSLKEMTMFMVAYTVFVDESRKQQLIPPFLSDIILELAAYLTSVNAVVRYCTAQCLSNIARIDGYLRPVLQAAVAPLQNQIRTGETSAHVRCGLVELLFLLSELHVEVLGGLRLLAPVSLRLMANSSQVVRETAAIAFRNLVPLMTLKANKKLEGQSVSKNDVADEIFGDSSIDLLLGDPSRLPELQLRDIKGLSTSTCLRRYQQEGIRWLSFLEEYGLSGILADDMGLGKTLQTLCLLALKIHDKPTAKVLIICPPTLVSHWCAEWSKFFPSLTPFYNVEESFKNRIDFATKKQQIVAVASYNTVRFCSYFQEVDWYYVILDEGHVIRNPTTQLFKAVTSIKSQNRLILSGTPVQNTPADLWALFQFLMPGYLGTMKQFRSSFLNVINSSRNINASAQEIKEGQDALERLHKSILPFVMRRLKTEVLKDLPEKIVQDYMCSMTSVQRCIYTHIVDTYRTSGGSSSRQGFCALETIAELRKCIVHPVLVNRRVLEEMHLEGLQNCVEESGKMIALRELLKECGIGSREQYALCEEPAVQENDLSDACGHRALIFCQRLTAVQLLMNLFDDGELGANIRYAVLDGSVPVSKRHAVAERFNNDPSIHVLILTTNVGGEGLNLVGADIIIFLEHDWNPVKDLQAMDRAHRIGQKYTVNVYRLITEGSIEQKVMRFQKFKTDTANALVGADNKSLQTMATEQLVELFAMDDVSPGTSHDAHYSKKSRERDASISVDESFTGAPDVGEKWNIQELWDLSQYDRYSASSVAQSFETHRLGSFSAPLNSDTPGNSPNVNSSIVECKKPRLDG